MVTFQIHNKQIEIYLNYLKIFDLKVILHLIFHFKFYYFPFVNI